MNKKGKNEITVIGQKIQTTIDEIDIFKLKYWKENPRVNAIIKQNYGDKEVTDADIEKLLWDKVGSVSNSVHELYTDIKKHGGLIDEIWVKGNTVLEGNSRLCVYRKLYEKAEQKNDEEEILRWSYIRARILPEDTSYDVIFSILGTWHIKGKTQWDTYEKAAYFKRMNIDYGYSFKDISNSISETEKFVKDHVEAHDLMVENKVADLEKFSSFYQLVLEKNNSKYSEYFKKEPEITNQVIETIKNEGLKRAEELRDLPKILKDPKAKKEYLSGNADFSEALEIAKSKHPEYEDKFYEQMKKTTKLLKNCSVKQMQEIMQEINNDKQRKYILKALHKEVDNFCKKIEITD